MVSQSSSPASNSFATPLPTSSSHRAPSVISSQMTDVISEDGEDFRAEGAASRRRSAAGVSSRGHSNDIARPPSARSSQTRSWTQTPPRRTIPSPLTGSWRSGGVFGGPGGTMTNSSRPQSSTNSTSRTHVPSLASHAFFHPMSSQRLQAQRAGRTTEKPQTIPRSDHGSELGSNTNRPSLESNATVQRGTTLHQDNDFPPASRGTEFTEPEDRGTATASPTGNATLRSIGDSESPLQKRYSNPLPGNLDLGGNYKQVDPGSPITQKSPKSFRTNFFHPPKGSVPVYNDIQDHKRLSSSTPSPNHGQSKLIPDMKPKAGINYQYFSGNTVFCWGGRLQNTRDRPINIATGILVVLPSALFLSYSSVEHQDPFENIN